MTTKQPTLHGYPLKVGDRVWHLRFGWSRVTQIFSDNEFLIESEEDEIERGRYDEEGKVSFTDQSSVVFWQPVEITPPPKPEPKIDWTKVPQGTPVEVRDSSRKDWLNKKFLVYSKEKLSFGHYVVFDDAGVVNTWRYCRLVPDVEVKKEWLK